jgi:hypothetical protein
VYQGVRKYGLERNDVFLYQEQLVQGGAGTATASSTPAGASSRTRTCTCSSAGAGANSITFSFTGAESIALTQPVTVSGTESVTGLFTGSLTQSDAATDADIDHSKLTPLDYSFDQRSHEYNDNLQHAGNPGERLQCGAADRDYGGQARDRCRPR